MEYWPELVAVRTERSDQGPQCAVSKLFTIWQSVSESKMPCLDNKTALLHNKSTRLGPFPWKWSVLQNPNKVRTNRSAGDLPDWFCRIIKKLLHSTLHCACPYCEHTEDGK